MREMLLFTGNPPHQALFPSILACLPEKQTSSLNSMLLQQFIFSLFHYSYQTRLMASLKNHLFELKITVSVLLIFHLTMSSSKSVGSVPVTDNDSSKEVKMVLGSRPPKCVNRCFSCRPCMAALVTSPHHRNDPSSSYQGDENYYLLAWKCKCGDKFFQP